MPARPVVPAVAGRLAAAGLGGLALSLAAAGPALAHIDVTGKPAQAGAHNAVLTFVAEAESQTAGITGVKVQLPDGITPADVALVSAPTGWRLTKDATTYTVQGPPVAPGRDATYSVRVAQLPDAGTLAFKSIQSYSDGRKDSWIELPGADGREPDMPAPVLRLAPAVPTTATPTTRPGAPTTAAPTTTPAAPVAAETDPAGGGSATPWIIGAVLIVLVGAGAGYSLSRRRAG